MAYKTGFYKGRLGIGLTDTMGMGDGNPRYPLDINGDIRITGSIVNEVGKSILGGGSSGATMALRKQTILAEPTWTDDVISVEDMGLNDLLVTGDLQLNGTLKDSTGADIIFSNWVESGTHIYRDSGVTIGQNSVNNGSYKLYVNGNTHVQGTIQATSTVTAPTFNGALSGNATTATTAGTVTTAAQPTITSLGTLSNLSVASAGSALLPAYTSWIGDTNNTKRAWGTGYMHWTTDTAAWELTLKNGNVGIGTTTPVSALTIGGTTTTLSDTIITLASDGGSAYKQGIKMIHHGGAPNGGTDATQYGWYMFGSDVTDKLHIGSYNGSSTESDHLVITRDTGNVGIGRSDPTQVLDVKFPDATSGDDPLFIQATRSGLGHAGVGFRAGDGNWHAFWEHTHGDPDRMNFGMYRAGSGKQVYMALTHQGRLGIGTASPAQKLDISADANGNDCFFQFSQPYNSALLDGWVIGGAAYDTYNTTGYDFVIKKLRSGTTGNVIIPDGNVGIGTTNPGAPLEIYKKGHNTDEKGGAIILSRYVHGIDGGNQPNDPYRGSCIWHEYTDGNDCMMFASSSNANPYTLSPSMVLTNQGNVGIGTSSPGFPLEVAGNTLFSVGYVGYINYNNITSGNASGDDITIKASNSIWAGQYVFASSDERIKKNIVDVPDNLALEMVRNIPVRYYEYKNTLERGFNKTIGFIAQDVKEVLPMAVSLQKNIIPNEMRNLTDINWNDTTLYTDLSDCSGVKYRFYVSNDENEIKKEVIGNSDNTFTFDEQWNNVFCYGKEVDDFHTLDKNKLFALNFSATQELDRKIIAIEDNNNLQINNTENIIGNIPFVNGYNIVNNKKLYNNNISDKLYFNPETGKLKCPNIESTYYGDGSNLQGIATESQINDLIEENKKLKQDNENNKELINFWTQQAMNLNNKLTTMENELKIIKENLGL